MASKRYAAKQMRRQIKASKAFYKGRPRPITEGCTSCPTPGCMTLVSYTKANSGAHQPLCPDCSAKSLQAGREFLEKH